MVGMIANSFSAGDYNSIAVAKDAGIVYRNGKVFLLDHGVERKVCDWIYIVVVIVQLRVLCMCQMHSHLVQLEQTLH